MPDNLPAFHLAAEGNWPRALLGSALGKDWKKSGKKRWKGPEGLELVLLPDNTLILSSRRADQMLSQAGNLTAVHSVFSEDARTFTPLNNSPLSSPAEPVDRADFALRMSGASLAGSLKRFLGESLASSLPLTAAEFVLLRNEPDAAESYRALFVLQPLESRLTGALALALRLGLSARFGLSANPAEQELLRLLEMERRAKTVVLQIPQVSMEQMESLLGSFCQ